MNKRGFELTISTLILIILGVAVLFGLILFFRGGLKSFEEGTSPILQTAEGLAVQQACEIACESGSHFAFCCSNHTIGNKEIKCDDARLEAGCNFACEEFSC